MPSRARSLSGVEAQGADSTVQGGPQRSRAEVRRHAGVDRGGRGVLMAQLLLDESGVEAVLDQMGRVRTPERMEGQLRGETELHADRGEVVLDSSLADSTASLGRPQHLATAAS